MGCSLNTEILGLPSLTTDPNEINPNDPVNSDALVLDKIQLQSIGGNTITFSFPYLGDVNNNSQVKVHFCSIKTQSGCSPVGTHVSILSRDSNNYFATVDLTTTSVTPGDFLKYQVEVIDSDGVSGGSDFGYVFIPQDVSNPSAIMQLNQFMLGVKDPSVLSMSEDEAVNTMVTDSFGNSYIGGCTASSMGEVSGGDDDIFIAKVNSNGVLDSTFANSGVFHIGMIKSSGADQDDCVDHLILDGTGNLFASGATFGALGGPNAGGRDGYILKLNSTSGALDADFGDGDGIDNDGIVQFNAANTNSATGSDYIYSIALDANGNIFGGGHSESSLGGASAGGNDGILIKLNAISGELDASFGDGDGIDNDGIVQLNAIGINSAKDSENIFSVIMDNSGNLYAGGKTSSSLGGVNGGSRDGFIMKLNASSGALDTDFGDGDGNDNVLIAMELYNSTLAIPTRQQTGRL